MDAGLKTRSALLFGIMRRQTRNLVKCKKKNWKKHYEKYASVCMCVYVCVLVYGCVYGIWMYIYMCVFACRHVQGLCDLYIFCLFVCLFSVLSDRLFFSAFPILLCSVLSLSCFACFCMQALAAYAVDVVKYDMTRVLEVRPQGIRQRTLCSCHL